MEAGAGEAPGEALEAGAGEAPGEFREARMSGIRAVGAVVLKSLRVHYRYRFNALMQLFNSVIWLPPLYFLGQAFMVDGKLPGLAAYTGVNEYGAFLVVGWIVAGYIYATFWGVGFWIYEEMIGGTLEANWLTPTPPWVLLAGQSLRMLLTTTLSSVILLAAAWGLMGVRFSGDAVRAALTLVPTLIALYGVGFALVALVLVTKDPGNGIDLLSYATTLIAGDRLPPRVLPGPLFVLALAIPLTYAFDGLRYALLGTTPILPFPIEVAILIGFMIVMVPLGYGLLLMADRRVRRLGTLAQH